MKALSSASHCIVAISLLTWGSRPSAADELPNMEIATTCPTSMALANLIAKSDLIVVATPDVPVTLVQSGMREDSPDYIDVRLNGASILKGADTGSNLTMKVYPKRTTYAPSPEVLVERTGKPSLLFLTRVDQGPIDLYLTDSVNALQDSSTMRVDAVKAEVHRQEVLSAGSPEKGSLPHSKEVRELVSALPRTTPQRQEEIFRKLEALGDEGVPAIVAQMDDRRTLAVSQITLVNHDPNAFEGLRHYGPKEVVDALDAILNQITGFGGSIVNGGSERARHAAVAAWRVYVADIGCH